MNQPTAYDCLTLAFPTRQNIPLVSWLAQAATLLKSGGSVSIRDVIVPGSRRRGKKAQMQCQAGRYVNALLQFARPEAGWHFSQPQWQDILQQAGFVVAHRGVTAVPHCFDDWAVSLSPANRLRLRVLLTQAPAPVLDYLTPHIAGDRITFCLQELLIIGVYDSS